MNLATRWQHSSEIEMSFSTFKWFAYQRWIVPVIAAIDMQASVNQMMTPAIYRNKISKANENMDAIVNR